ncbi:MAG: type II secretion system minor pseudopilin GspI [Gammaproteobacteria bacterium]|nr:type II secretion system minor pseudopilin GspI [Gammaproteobacteria bacterium]
MKKVSRPNLSIKGFTLLEVLVALTIITITMGALLQSVSVISRNETSLHTKKLLSWAAQNKLVEIQLGKDAIAIGQTSGEAIMAGQEVQWEADITSTSDADLFKVAVTTDLNNMSHSLYGYLGKNTLLTQ